jgi:ribosomal protein S18 acetylase RimI-like enzyme
MIKKDNLNNIVELTDSGIITDILNKAFMTVALQFNFTKENVPRFPAFITSNIIENQLNNGLKMYGYKNDEKITACVGYSYYKEQIYFIERLAALPDYRHLGIGKKLMNFVENKIMESGGKTAEIHVVDINIILVEWYKKLGYKEIRVDNLVDGAKELPFNSCVMNKILG